jgi:hypothetical protein
VRTRHAPINPVAPVTITVIFTSFGIQIGRWADNASSKKQQDIQFSMAFP